MEGELLVEGTHYITEEAYYDPNPEDTLLITNDSETSCTAYQTGKEAQSFDSNYVTMFYSPMDLVDCTLNQQEDGTFLSTDPAAISAASGMAIYRVSEETPTEVRFDLDEEENTLTITFLTDEGYYTDAPQSELEYGYYLRTVTIRNVGTTEIDVDSIISVMTGAAAE